MRPILICVILIFSCYASGSPCTGVDRTLPDEAKKILAPVIAKQLKTSSVTVKQSFKVGNWGIIYVSTPDSDPPFLFYSGNPLNNKFVLLWAGAAATYEENEIENWVSKNAPGIPATLAKCFAWHVTSDEDSDW